MLVLLARYEQLAGKKRIGQGAPLAVPFSGLSASFCYDVLRKRQSLFLQYPQRAETGKR